MLSRGFNGEVRSLRKLSLRTADVALGVAALLCLGMALVPYLAM
jgi:energy-coupling factor transporter transmembrane protein EcfT